VCVVLSSQGYPGSYKKGVLITGLDEAGAMENVVVFHAGTRLVQTKSHEVALITDGGRVLGVTATAEDIKGAIAKAYAAIGLIIGLGNYLLPIVATVIAYVILRLDRIAKKRLNNCK